ncbi:hypothetical protein [Kitasatospora sp. NPDC127060]|uniref:hypothetical protein n=1 Tax=Kitasatospora sp. NPDC127060 TaxID=3347121 RepID=UPI00364A10E6
MDGSQERFEGERQWWLRGGRFYTALDRAGLHALTDDDHQAVRDLTRHLDPATLSQVMSWLERTRTAAFALRGTEQSSPVRPVVRRSRF